MLKKGVSLLSFKLIESFKYGKVIIGALTFMELRTHATIDHTYNRKSSARVVKELGYDLGNNPNMQLETLYLNVRDKSHFPSSVNGELIFPDDTIFYIYDGQHRYLGLLLAFEKDHRFDKKEILVRITFSSREDEILTFIIHNALRKAVSPALNQLNLAQIAQSPSFIKKLKDHCGIIPDMPRQIQEIIVDTSDAVQYLQKLDKDVNSPLHNYILFDDEKGDPEKKKTKPIGQKTFVDYIVLSLKRMDIEQFPEWKNADQGIRDQMVLQYWAAIKQQMPEVFIRKTCKKYHLCGFFGVIFWNYIMPDIFQLAEMNPDNFSNVLSKMGQYITSDFWNKDNYKNTHGEIRTDATKSKRHAQAALEILQKNLGDKKNE
jgi:hypothetical protein